MSKRYVVARLDTRNGKAAFASDRDLLRNRSYVLVLSPDGEERGRLMNPKDLVAINRFLKKHAELETASE